MKIRTTKLCIPMHSHGTIIYMYYENVLEYDLSPLINSGLYRQAINPAYGIYIIGRYPLSHLITVLVQGIWYTLDELYYILRSKFRHKGLLDLKDLLKLEENGLIEIVQ